MERILNSQTKNYLGQKVKVCGWVQNIRSHGKIIFIDLRDRTAILQVVFGTENEILYKECQKLRPEWVIEIEGTINERPAKMVNPKIETGQIELQPQSLKILSEAETLPLPIDTAGYEISEEKRLKYRYLDLRRERLQKNLILRNKVIQTIREFLLKEGFIEIETPILTKSTPEGARDFIVPSRLQPGKFYALPQSPQQYKQLLMVAGMEKYFQVAKCLRDEDPRGDRQAEFTQIDMEMSFFEQEDILNLVQKLFKDVVEKIVPEKRIAQFPFPKIKYQTAMEKYNSDKPDLRQDKNNPEELAFAFVVDFPMFEWKKEEKRWDAVHHPFTKPQTEDAEEIKKNPDKILACQYDVVLNGYEIGGGSLRIYKPKFLEAIFEIMGHKKEAIHQKFGHLLKAFEYGVPPHGGIALGIDRFLMILANEPSIREVIAFPKTGDNRDLMMAAPSEVDESQLKELKIKLAKTKK